MEVEHLSNSSIANYLRSTSLLCSFSGKLPDALNENNIYDFLYWLKNDKKLSRSTVRNYLQGLRFMYKSIYKRIDIIDDIPYPKATKYLPVIPTGREVLQLFNGAKSPKHKLLLKVIYSAGLRRSEIINLKIEDIRGKFCDSLIDLYNKGTIVLQTPFEPERKYLHPFYKYKWVVYAKLPMYNAKQVLDYLGRYTHRVAISNQRIKKVDKNNVYFSWLNYRNSKVDIMHLSPFEFIRRFSMHILPSGFMKIRHYGIFSSCKKKQYLAIIREYLNAVAPESKKGMPWQELFIILFDRPHDQCPKCKKGTMRRIASFKPCIRRSSILHKPQIQTILLPI
jgi:site-specific recombinase XerD